MHTRIDDDDAITMQKNDKDDFLHPQALQFYLRVSGIPMWINIYILMLCTCMRL